MFGTNSITRREKHAGKSTSESLPSPPPVSWIPLEKTGLLNVRKAFLSPSSSWLTVLACTNKKGSTPKKKWGAVHYIWTVASTGRRQLKLSSPTETKISLGFFPFSPSCISSILAAESGKPIGMRGTRHPHRYIPTVLGCHPYKSTEIVESKRIFQSVISKTFHYTL